MSSEYTILIHDVETNEITIREMTEKEIAALQETKNGNQPTGIENE